MGWVQTDLTRRLGIWALLQALPDERTLRAYLQRAYFGLAGVIVGSVLTGAALSLGLFAGYRLLLDVGWTPMYALLLTLYLGIAIICGCFYFAGRWFAELASIKQETAVFGGVGRELTSGLLHTLTTGFLDGMAERKRKNVRQQQNEWRSRHRKKSK